LIQVNSTRSMLLRVFYFFLFFTSFTACIHAKDSALSGKVKEFRDSICKQSVTSDDVISTYGKPSITEERKAENIPNANDTDVLQYITYTDRGIAFVFYSSAVKEVFLVAWIVTINENNKDLYPKTKAECLKLFGKPSNTDDTDLYYNFSDGILDFEFSKDKLQRILWTTDL